MAWCSLDPDNRADRERFSDLIHQGRSPTNRETKAISAAAIRAELTLRVAMLFPKTNQKSSNGVPPGEGGAQQPVVPTAAAFAGETVDCVLFPEGYIRASDRRRTRALQKLASDLGAPLLVGAIDNSVDSTPRVWQVLLRFDPNRSGPSRVYVKHSTAEAVAFERPDWEPRNVLPTFELNGVSAGATICHDSYLGLLPKFLARCGARLWVNPSFDNVTDIKWSSILRLRAVENRFFAMCTLHCDVTRRRTHPFAFGPDGNALSARKAGSEVQRPLSECVEAGQIYVVDDMVRRVGHSTGRSSRPPINRSGPGTGSPDGPFASHCEADSRLSSEAQAGKPSVPAFMSRLTKAPYTWEWCRKSGFWIRPCAFAYSITQNKRTPLRSSGTNGIGYQPNRSDWRRS